MKKRKLLVWLLLPVFVGLVMAATELICNRAVLTLPQEQRGEIALPPGGVTAVVASPERLASLGLTPSTDEGETAAEDEFAEEEEGDAPTGVAFASAYSEAALPYSGYVNKLRVTYAGSTDTRYRAYSADGSGAHSSFYDSGLGMDVLRMGENVEGLTLLTDAGDTILTSVTVVNTFVWNGMRMLFSGLCAAAVYLLFALREMIGRKAEYGFLIVALMMGIFMTVALPKSANLSWDDEIHFARAWEMSVGMRTTSSEASESLSAMGRDDADTLEEMKALEPILDAKGTLAPAEDDADVSWMLYDVGYAAQALGLALGRALGLPFHVQVICGRLFNLLQYVLLCFLAIRATRRFKLIFATVALLPTAMFLACNFAYDPACIGLCLLGIALALDESCEAETPLRRGRLLVMLLCFVTAGLIKVVYLSLILLVLTLPRGKFASKGQMLWVKIGAMVIMLAAFASVALPTGQPLMDTRIEGANAGEQFRFILTHPFTYAGYFFRALWEHFDVYLVDSYRTLWAYLGGLNTTWSTISLALVLVTCFGDNDPQRGGALRPTRKLAYFVIALLTLGMIFTAMYIYYSEVGADSFGGVQGRYLLPMLPLLYVLFPNGFLKNRVNKALWNPLMPGLNGVVLMAQCALMVLIPLWL